MSTFEQKIIVDYLSRKRWFYICGAIFHLIAICAKELSLLGIMGGSALALSGEFMRSGNSTTRTLLALPLTSKQLANSWRFVGLILPIVLYFLVLVLAAIIRPSLGGASMSLERFAIIALIQTGIIGSIFLALTGIQNPGNFSTEFAYRVQLSLSGLLPGLLIIALSFALMVAPSNFSEITTGHAIGGILLIVATVGSWFRAEILVSRRTVRPADRSSKREGWKHTGGNMPWIGFGGLLYFLKHIFGRIFFISIVMYSAVFFIVKYLRGFNSSNTDQSSVIDGSPMGFLISAIGLMAIIQFVPSLRIMRTMPHRLSTITHCLVFWPFALTFIFALITLLVQLLLSGGGFDWNRSLIILLGNSFTLFGLPIILRFGIGIGAFIPIIFLHNISIALGSFIEIFFAAELLSYWSNIIALIMVILMLVWYLTFRVLNSPYPWRSNLMKLPGMQRNV